MTDTPVLPEDVMELARKMAEGRFARWFSVLIEQHGVRGVERLMGNAVSKATISRANRGVFDLNLSSAKALGKVVGACPCCDQKWPKDKAETST